MVDRAQGWVEKAVDPLAGRVGNLRAFFTCPSAVRISRHSRFRLAFKMYGHPIWGGCVAQDGAKTYFPSILYPWFRRRFRTVFDRC